MPTRLLFASSPFGAPSAITDLDATVLSTSRIALDWSAPINDGGSILIGYEIQRLSTSSSLFTTIRDAQIQGLATTFVDSNISDSSTHTYRIVAENLIDSSLPSNEVTATTLDASQNVPPNANSDNESIPKGTVVTIDVLSNDDDLDDDVITLTSVNDPVNGTASIVTANDIQQVTYTPDQDFVGVDTFEYTISAGTHTSNGTIFVIVRDPADASLYVASLIKDSVPRYSLNGTFIDNFVSPASGGLDGPQALAWGPDEHLYVASGSTNQILRYHGVTGQPLGISGSDAVFASVNIDDPDGLLFSPDGSFLLVANSDDHNIVRIDASTGEFIEVFGDATATTGLSNPKKMVWGPADGHLYVASSNNQILRYHGITGQALGISGVAADATFSSNADLDDPQGIAWGPDNNLYAGNDDDDNVVRINGVTGASLGQFNEEIQGLVDGPSALLFDVAGDLYVANKGDFDVVVFNGPSNNNAGQFNRTAVTVDFVINQRPSDMTFGPKPASLPGPVANLAAVPISGSQIDLTWSAPANDGGFPIVGYMIERYATAAESAFSILVSDTGNTNTNYSDTGLASSTQYSYRVYAINTGGTSANPSNTVSAITISSNIPPIANNDTYSVLEDSTMTLTVLDNDSDPDGVIPSNAADSQIVTSTTGGFHDAMGTYIAYYTQPSQIPSVSFDDVSVNNATSENTISKEKLEQIKTDFNQERSEYQRLKNDFKEQEQFFEKLQLQYQAQQEKFEQSKVHHDQKIITDQEFEMIQKDYTDFTDSLDMQKEQLQGITAQFKEEKALLKVSKDIKEFFAGNSDGVDPRIKAMIQESQDTTSQQENTKIPVFVQLDANYAGTINDILTPLANDDIIVTRLQSTISATLTESQLHNLVQSDKVQSVSLPELPELYDLTDITSQGITTSHADRLHSQGINGTSVSIAVIDDSFVLGSLDSVSYSALFDSSGLCGGSISCGKIYENSHGTATAGIIQDMAPGSELELYAIANSIDFVNAINHIIQRGQADVISISLGFPAAGGDGTTGHFRDGTSIVAKAVNDARNAGILVITAAGNDAARHWSGNYTPSSTVSPESLELSESYQSVLEFDSTADGLLKACLPVHHAGWSILSWNQWDTTTQDYDMFLYDGTMNNLYAYSVHSQSENAASPLEVLRSAAKSNACLVVASINSTQNHYLHINTVGGAVNSPVSNSSISTPADAAGSVTAGAVNYATGNLESFSSVGPTDDGRAKPEICGYDGVSSIQDRFSPFYGTSAAAPHIAGTVSLLLQLEPRATPENILATLYRDAQELDDGNCGAGIMSLLSASQNVTSSNQTRTPTPVNPDESNSEPEHTPLAESSVTISSTTQPENGSVTITGNSLSVSYTPNLNYNGQDMFSYVITDDAGDTDTATVSINVTPVNDAPVIMQITNHTLEPHTNLSFTVTATDVDDADILTFSLSSNDTAATANATINSTTGAFSWTPSQIGVFAFDVTLSDNGTPTESDTASFIVSVRDNVPPVITAPPPKTFEATAMFTPINASLLGQATAIDNFDPDPTITHDAPESFSLGNNTVIWTATDNSGNSATATQSVTLLDNTTSGVTISRTSASDPVNADQTITVTFGGPVSGFDASDISIHNATISGFAGSGSTYSFTATTAQSSMTQVTISVPAGAATGIISGIANAESNTISFAVDKIPPTFAAFAISNNQTLIIFSETVTGTSDLRSWSIDGMHPRSVEVFHVNVNNDNPGVMNVPSRVTTLVFDHDAPSLLVYTVRYDGMVLSDGAGNTIITANSTVQTDTVSPTITTSLLTRTKLLLIFNEPIGGTLDLTQWVSNVGHAVSADGHAARGYPLPGVTSQMDNISYLALNFNGPITSISYTGGSSVTHRDGRPIDIAVGLIPQLVDEMYNVTNIATVPGRFYGMDADGDYAYPVRSSGSARIIDMTDKTRPFLTGPLLWAGYAVGAAGDHVYVAGNSAGMSLWDVSDKSNVMRAGSAPTANTYGTESIAIDGNYVYASSQFNYRNSSGLGYYHNHGLSIINASDKASPVLLSSISDSRMAGELYVAVDGNHAYVSSRTGLTSIDISNKTQPRILDHVPMGEPGRLRTVALDGDRAYIGLSGIDLLGIVDISDPSNMNTSYARGMLGHDTRKMAIAAGHAFVLTSQSGVILYDISDPSNTRVVKSMPHGSYTGGLAGIDVSDDGRYMYTSAPTGFRIFEVTYPPPAGASGQDDDAVTGLFDSWPEQADFVSPVLESAFLDGDMLVLEFNEPMSGTVDTALLSIGLPGRNNTSLAGAVASADGSPTILVTLTAQQVTVTSSTTEDLFLYAEADFASDVSGNGAMGLHDGHLIEMPDTSDASMPIEDPDDSVYTDILIMPNLTQIQDNSIAISWTLSGMVDQYKAVIIWPNGTKYADGTISGNTTQYRFINLQPDTPYEIRIGIKGDDSTQESIHVTTLPNGNDTFESNLLLDAITLVPNSDKINLSWNDLNDIGENRYRVERSVNGVSYESTDLSPKHNSTIQDTIRPDWLGKEISYRVFERLGNQKMYSDNDVSITLPATLEAPQNLQAELGYKFGSGPFISINWDDVPLYRNYILDVYNQDTNSWERIAKVQSNSYQYQIERDSEFEFRVYSQLGHIQSAPTQVQYHPDVVSGGI